jgi:hypothetical protein
MMKMSQLLRLRFEVLSFAWVLVSPCIEESSAQSLRGLTCCPHVIAFSD